MKSWNLFTNGEFGALAHTNYGKEIITIVGCEWLRNSPDCWIIKGVNLDTKIEVAFGSREVTLIARPIEDMTDEELLEISKGKPADWVKQKWAKVERQRLIYEADNNYLSFRTAERLINKGVYFGPQSHFGDTVINANSLEEA